MAPRPKSAGTEGAGPGPTADARDVYTVTRLNQEARDLLELNFPYLWVEGEVSNLARPPSGHLYFTLKDASSQIRCVLFKNANRLLRTLPRDGQKVLVRAHPSLYTARGDFQLLVEFLEDYGAGDLRRAFELLQQKLLAEGLFDLYGIGAVALNPTGKRESDELFGLRVGDVHLRQLLACGLHNALQQL